MTYEEIMGITPGSIVPNGFSITPNATYIGPGEPILDAEGNAAPGGHYVNKWDKILVLDIGYTRQLTLIQYPVGNNEVRQGYITNSLSKIEYSDLENNFWQNGSTTETVYLSCSGDAVLGSLNPHERAIFLYKAGGRYSVVYSTDKGPYTKSGFVKYPGGISDQITQGRCLASGGSLINGIPAGGIVPGGRTYPANANAQVDLDVRDAHGNSIPGREVNAGDELTVLDVGYTRQLALVQYPAGGAIRQGYVTNNARYIKYKNPNNWYNGSTPEPVLDGNGVQIGTINPYEMATRLYEANGLIEVVYNTDKGINTKSGFVKYPGTTPHVVHVDIPYPNVTSAELINYGTSGKGRPLRAYKIGNGRNSFIYNCAIHGWEDNWPADGVELTKIGNQIIEHFQNNSTGDFTLYVIPAANPDGVSEGWTNNGPGRCTIVGGIDCNRDFPVGFTPGGRPRNYTGAEPLSVPESRDLANFVQGVKNKTAGKTYLIDMHGWEQSAIGSSIIGEHFVGKLGLEPKYRYANAGYLIDWANSIGIISTLLELPTATHSHADVVNGNYAGKIIEGLTEIMGTSSSSTGGNYNGKIKSGTEWVNVREEPNTTSTILGQLHGDDPIEILAKTKPYGDSYYWYKIVFVKNGERLQAYVREDFVTVTGEIPKSDIPAGGGEPSKIDIAYQTVGQVNDVAASVHVRKGAGTGAGCDVVTSVNSGELLMILGEVQPGGETLPWYEIDINGQELYIRSDFVDIVSEEKMDKQGKVSSSEGWVHLRELPGTGSECTVITTLNNGDWMELIGKLQPKGESLPWYRIKWQSTIGFIRSDFVSFDGTEGSNNSNVNINYCRIAKAFGFDINKSLAKGVSTEIKVPNDINFKATAIVLEEQLDEFNSIRVYNGSIINTPKNYNDLNVPYGKQTLSKLAQMLGNGLISFEITVNNDITIIINAIENGARNSTSLRIKLQCISDSSNWTSLLTGIEGLGKGILAVVGVVGVVGVILACAPGEIVIGAEVAGSAASEALGGAALEELEKFTEETTEKGVDETTEKGVDETTEAELINAAKAENKQWLIEYISKIPELKKEGFLLGQNGTQVPSKISRVVDLTDLRDNKYGLGYSNIRKLNLTVSNEAAKDFFKDEYARNMQIAYMLESKRTLTMEALNDFMETSEFIEINRGINEITEEYKEQIREEYKKFLSMVNETITRADAAGKESLYGNPSFEDWDVENCAEIWAVRNAILIGIKLKDMVITTFKNDGAYAEPCRNCAITFKEFGIRIEE